MNTLSGIIIAKNEEKMILDCLRSLAFCDEILVIDAGSTDETVAICKKQGAVVISFATNNFAEARNKGRELAKGAWILYVDADERVTKELSAQIMNEMRKGDQAAHAYRVSRKNYYLGNHEWPEVEKLERLFQKKYLKKWYGELHESALIDGEIAELSGLLLHYTHQDIVKMLEKTLQWSKIEANLRYQAHHPPVVWWRFPRVMLTAFYRSFVVQKGWKLGTVGLIESIYQSFSIFVTYARLWEMQKNK